MLYERFVPGSCVVLLAGVLTTATAAPSKELTVRIGHQKQLFVDDYIIDELTGVKKVLNPFQKYKANPVLKLDKPWEYPGKIGQFATIYDEQEHVYKAWYHAARIRHDKAPKVYGCYATSKDGVNWGKPNLGLFDYEGSTQNNILNPKPGEVALSVVKDRGEADPAKRYKRLQRGQDGHYFAEYSTDGIHWTRLSDRTNMRFVDDPCYVNFDGQRNRWAFYRRCWIGEGGACVWGWPAKRGCGLALSQDFIHWHPNGQSILGPNEEDERWAQQMGGKHAELHSMRGFPYEGIWLGLLDFYVVTVPAVMDKNNRIVTGSQDDGWRCVQLTSSRDGLHWKRYSDRTPLIGLGKEGSWDGGDICYTTEPIIKDDEIWIFYHAYNCTHFCPSWYGDLKNSPLKGGPGWKERHNHALDAKTGSIGLAKLRLDGFVSIDAAREEGSLLTKPLKLEGSNLVINAEARSGQVAVEILDQDGSLLPGFSLADCKPFSGDSVRHTVQWKGNSDLSRLKGQSVRLRFHLQNAKLYSFLVPGQEK